MGIISSFIDGAFATANNAGNIVHQIKENEKDRAFNAEQAQLNRDFQSKEAELAYERQQEFYDTRQSPAAMVQQYQKAGLNPSLLAGGASGSSSPQSSPSGSAAHSSSSAMPQMVDVMKSVVDLEAIKASIAESKVRKQKTEAEEQKIRKETSWIDTYNTTNVESLKAGIEQVKSNIKVNEQQVEESLQRVQESLKRMDKMDSEIEVNGALVDLHGSQQVLNESRAAVEKMNAKQIEMLLPYIQARQEAEIALTNAKTDEAKYSAESFMYEANLKMLKSLVDAKLIDSSYYDSVIDQAHWDAKYKKREYKWKPVNDICHNVSMLAIGVGSLMSGVGGAASGLGQAAVVGQSLAPRNPIGF